MNPSCCISNRPTSRLLLIGRLLMAGYFSLQSGMSLAAAEIPESDSASQMLVMSDGRILQGNITRHAAGYYVERNGGSILIPQDQVRCIARDIKHAYHLQREQMLEPTSAMLIQLAEWCISYRLYEEAGDELRRTLRHDPENETARKMLGRLDEMLRVNPAKSIRSPRLDAQGMIAADVESLGGFSRKSAAEFTSKIQPLLMNKCGNAGCHGSAAENDFRLTHVRLGSSNHRRASEQNLALVLKYVDFSSPAASALLTKPEGPHGGTSFAIFGGASGAIQEKLLKSWIHDIAAERQTEEDKYAARTNLMEQDAPNAQSLPSSNVQLANAEVLSSRQAIPPNMLPASPDSMPNATDFSPGTATPPIPAGKPAEPPHRLDIPEDQMVPIPPQEQAAQTPRFDPFDPEEFNRQFGGQKGR